MMEEQVGPKLRKVHFVGVGGVGTGTLAVALSASGCEVTGSDQVLYEPMKSVLASANVYVTQGYSAAIAEKLDPDVVIIGNVIRRDNPEAMAWIQRGKKFISFPEAVRIFLIEDRKSIVCAGTHGKTTTTSWIAFLLDRLGMQPSYLVGGVPLDLPSGCRLSAGNVFVGEGDEYDSAFFDKGPKFLHYKPDLLVLSNIEFDHADIYKDLAHVRSSFEKLIAILPGDGVCIARVDDPVVMEVISGALCPVQSFGLATTAMWRLGKVVETTKGFEFEVIYKGRSVGTFKTPLFGEHNLLNLLSGIVCAINLGQTMDRIRPVVEAFTGVRRRQELCLESPIVLIDDFAHHPTEVSATLKGVRRRFPEGKLWAVFEPRSATARRNVHQEEYTKAFDSADHTLLATPFKLDDVAQPERLSTDQLAQALTASGKNARTFPDSKAILDCLQKECRKGDIVVVMSNGEFDKIQEQIRRAFP